ncbi:MAG: alanine--tRNA ligase, partial [Bacilli bacterium]|nr:alanine--tRNA ligase [Bacilli bacterium]
MELINKEPRIFIISGKARHGKDTTAQIIEKVCKEKEKKVINLAFASYIKMYAQKIFDWDGNEETKPRALLQQLGTEIIRNKIDNYLFINRIIEDIKVYSYFFDVITISDARLVEEIEEIKKHFPNVFSVNIYRTNYDTVLTGNQQKHRTEIGLDNYDNYDYKLINDGSLDDLEIKVRAMLGEEPDIKKLSSNDIRNKWFAFWKSKNHKIVESASLIPVNDASLLWVNAGVTPLKKYFDGSAIPDSRRMASCQKCIRTNDIENVGLTARHQTFFEMLGNFSIGDYFKKEAITYAYEFLTDPKWMNFDKDKLYMTIYSDDEVAYQTWLEAGVEPSHIIRLESNFWEIGAGPSGPDSEIFYDRGEKYDKDKIGIKLLQDEIDNDRYIEIWNNVFSMYNAKPGTPRSEYKELPSKNIDTGMGLERMTSIVQGVETNFDTDLFMPIIDKISEISNIIYNGEMSFKVIADHIRTIIFALADGANFGNSGRDYILRRLLRRAAVHGKKLGIEKPFMADIVPVVIDVMKEPYPYLQSNQEMIINKIKQEETLFMKTLSAGEKKIEELFSTSDDKMINGEEAFKLYDTYGFPFELTLEYAKEKGFNVSKEEFDLGMTKQKELARASRNSVSSMNMQNAALLNFKDESQFVGYDDMEANTKIIALFDGTNFVSTLTNEGYIVLEKTPFYAESGGQVSDSGIIMDNGKILTVEEIFKSPNKQHFHYVKFEGTISLGDEVKAMVDKSKRYDIMKNHSATHLLQKALQEVLGSNVHQAGSKVDENGLRFDFVYDKKISTDELINIEKLVNDKIKTNSATITEIMSSKDAKQTGAMALFDEKYGNEVRVVSMADSKELCGGTHVQNVSDIEKFAIKSLENKG